MEEPRGDHEDPQKTADRKAAPEKKPDYLAFRDKAFLHLYRSMNIAMDEMANDKLHNSVRVKWAHCLAQTVAALCNLIRTLKILESDEYMKDDLAMLIMKIREAEEKERKEWEEPTALAPLTHDTLTEIEEEAADAPKKYRNAEYMESLRKKLIRGLIWSRRSRMTLGLRA